MNLQTNGGQKVALAGCCKSSETPAQSTDSQVAADHEVPALKKTLTWLMIWFWVKKIRRRLTSNRLQCDPWFIICILKSTGLNVFKSSQKSRHSISVYRSVMTSLPRTVSRSIDAMTTSMLSSSEKSELDIVSMLVWSLCSSLCSSLVCMSSIRRRTDLKSAIIVCVSNSVQVTLWTVMWWCEVVNVCRVSSSTVTTSASSKHLSYLQYTTIQHIFQGFTNSRRIPRHSLSDTICPWKMHWRRQICFST